MSVLAIIFGVILSFAAHSQTADAQSKFKIEAIDAKKNILQAAHLCEKVEAQPPQFKLSGVPKGAASIFIVMGTETPAQMATSEPTWQVNLLLYGLPPKNGKVDIDGGEASFGKLESKKDPKARYVAPCASNLAGVVKVTAYALKVDPKFFAPPGFGDLLTAAKDATLAKAELTLSLTKPQ